MCELFNFVRIYLSNKEYSNERQRNQIAIRNLSINEVI